MIINRKKVKNIKERVNRASQERQKETSSQSISKQSTPSQRDFIIKRSNSQTNSKAVD